VIAIVMLATAPLVAQRGRGAAPAVPPRAAAPVDLTGYWVSIVTEDWRWRMVTPAKGDYDSVPLNAAARRAADAWDPKHDEAAGEACRSYGAPAIMRVPGRIHVTWDNDSTLHIDTEAGTQTRILRFGPPSPTASASQVPPSPTASASQGLSTASASQVPPSPTASASQVQASEPTWQGQSVAQWELGGRGGGMFGVAQAKPSGALKVVTTRLRPGYLRKNGVPYSANAILTEYFNALPPEENGDTWLVITTVVADPQFLNGRFITSSHFKKLPDGNAWHPTPCRSS
jgi:hypothetical protein